MSDFTTCYFLEGDGDLEGLKEIFPERVSDKLGRLCLTHPGQRSSKIDNVIKSFNFKRTGSTEIAFLANDL